MKITTSCGLRKAENTATVRSRACVCVVVLLQHILHNHVDPYSGRKGPYMDAHTHCVHLPSAKSSISSSISCVYVACPSPLPWDPSEEWQTRKTVCASLRLARSSVCAPGENGSICARYSSKLNPGWPSPGTASLQRIDQSQSEPHWAAHFKRFLVRLTSPPHWVGVFCVNSQSKLHSARQRYRVSTCVCALRWSGHFCNRLMKMSPAIVKF